MAFLNKGIRITFTDERADPVTERVFHYEGGIIEFVKYLNKNKEVLFEEPIYIEGIMKGTSGGSGVPVQRFLSGKYLHLCQQHSHAGGRHPSDRLFLPR